MLREGTPVGVINIRRQEVRPFSEKQIALLKTFADQAVIAIENVRLFKEIQERNAELREALEHQTATSEVLGIISRSPTDVQPVLDAIVESAARICGIDDVYLRLREEDVMVPRAHYGSTPIQRVEVPIDAPQLLWMREHGTLHIPDALPARRRSKVRFYHGSLAHILGRSSPATRGPDRRTIRSSHRSASLHADSDQTIRNLRRSSRDRLENVRLFQELKEALEQQTATSEILGVIASSPTDIQPVLDTVAEHAARLCDASDALIFE